MFLADDFQEGLRAHSGLELSMLPQFLGAEPSGFRWDGQGDIPSGLPQQFAIENVEHVEHGILVDIAIKSGDFPRLCKRLPERSDIVGFFISEYIIPIIVSTNPNDIFK